MSSQDIPEENLPVEQGHAHGAVDVADEQNPFADPGLPPHEHRVQDIDERAAKRSERAVAFLFTLSMLATVGFIVSYVAIPADKSIFVFPIGHINALNFALGLTLGLALFAIGAGAVHWARTLMSDRRTARLLAESVLEAARGGVMRECSRSCRSRASRRSARATTWRR